MSTWNADIEARLPSQHRFEELAEYFDRTDTSELPMEEATDAVIESPVMEEISVSLSSQDVAELKRRAEKFGIGDTTLLRMIARDYLRRPSHLPYDDIRPAIALLEPAPASIRGRDLHARPSRR